MSAHGQALRRRILDSMLPNTLEPDRFFVPIGRLCQLINIETIRVILAETLGSNAASKTAQVWLSSPRTFSLLICVNALHYITAGGEVEGIDERILTDSGGSEVQGCAYSSPIALNDFINTMEVPIRLQQKIVEEHWTFSAPQFSSNLPHQALASLAILPFTHSEKHTNPGLADSYLAIRIHPDHQSVYRPHGSGPTSFMMYNAD